jgi:hypothetical protein
MNLIKGLDTKKKKAPAKKESTTEESPKVRNNPKFIKGLSRR